MNNKITFGDLSLPLKILIVLGWLALAWNIIWFFIGFYMGYNGLV